MGEPALLREAVEEYYPGAFSPAPRHSLTDPYPVEEMLLAVLTSEGRPDSQLAAHRKASEPTNSDRAAVIYAAPNEPLSWTYHTGYGSDTRKRLWLPYADDWVLGGLPSAANKGLVHLAGAAAQLQGASYRIVNPMNYDHTPHYRDLMALYLVWLEGREGLLPSYAFAFVNEFTPAVVGRHIRPGDILLYKSSSGRVRYSTSVLGAASKHPEWWRLFLGDLAERSRGPPRRDLGTMIGFSNPDGETRIAELYVRTRSPEAHQNLLAAALEYSRGPLLARMGLPDWPHTRPCLSDALRKDMATPEYIEGLTTYLRSLGKARLEDAMRDLLSENRGNLHMPYAPPNFTPSAIVIFRVLVDTTGELESAEVFERTYLRLASVYEGPLTVTLTRPKDEASLYTLSIARPREDTRPQRP